LVIRAEFKLVAGAKYRGLLHSVIGECILRYVSWLNWGKN